MANPSKTRGGVAVPDSGSPSVPDMAFAKLTGPIPAESKTPRHLAESEMLDGNASGVRDEPAKDFRRHSDGALTATASLPDLDRRDLREEDPKARAIVDGVVGFWPNDGTAPDLRREMTVTERGYLRMRQRDLHGILRPLSIEERKHAAKAIAAMFLGFPNMRTADNQATVTAYIAALEQYPLFAITEACADVIRDRVDINPDFAPSAPRMCELATRHLIPLRGELAVIEKTITARYERNPISDEERERVRKGLEELAGSMMERDKIQRREHLTHQSVVIQEAAMKTIFDHYRALGIEPIYADADKKILLSPALAGKPGKPAK